MIYNDVEEAYTKAREMSAFTHSTWSIYQMDQNVFDVVNGQKYGPHRERGLCLAKFLNGKPTGQV